MKRRKWALENRSDMVLPRQGEEYGGEKKHERDETQAK
jgi:hypothetical protein